MFTIQGKVAPMFNKIRESFEGGATPSRFERLQQLFIIGLLLMLRDCEKDCIKKLGVIFFNIVNTSIKIVFIS